MNEPTRKNRRARPRRQDPFGDAQGEPTDPSALLGTSEVIKNIPGENALFDNPAVGGGEGDTLGGFPGDQEQDSKGAKAAKALIAK